MRHIISVLLENEAGALSRVVGLFSARGYNIETLTVAPTEDATLSRMTIVTSGSDDIIEQITKHLNRLIEVVKVVDLTEGAHIERELMLIKVRAVGKEREEMKRTADIFLPVRPGRDVAHSESDVPDCPFRECPDRATPCRDRGSADEIGDRSRQAARGFAPRTRYATTVQRGSRTSSQPDIASTGRRRPRSPTTNRLCFMSRVPGQRAPGGHRPPR